MPTEIRYHLDENVNHAVAHGLRLRGIDVTTATETALIGATDEVQLAFAHSNGRILVTHDDDHLRLHDEGTAHSGIAYAHQQHRTIGQIVLTLVDLWRNRTAEDFENHVEFL